MKRFLPLSLLLHVLLLSAMATAWRPPAGAPAAETIALELVTDRPATADHAQLTAGATTTRTLTVPAGTRATRVTPLAHARGVKQPEPRSTPAPAASAASPLARAGDTRNSSPAPVRDARAPDEPAIANIAPHTDAARHTVAAADDSGTADSRVRTALSAQVRAHFSYPRRARQRGWEGTVRVGIRVGAAGQILQLRIVQSSHHTVLDQAALDCLARIHRVPGAMAWLAGHASDIVLPIEYRLTDG